MEIIGKVTKNTIGCQACQGPIDANNWYSYVMHAGKTYKIHDDPYCLATLRVRLGLELPSFWSMANPSWVLQGFSRRVSRKQTEY